MPFLIILICFVAIIVQHRTSTHEMMESIGIGYQFGQVSADEIMIYTMMIRDDS